MNGPAQVLTGRNRLLSALAPDEQAQVYARGHVVPLASRQILHRPDQPIDAIYFPEIGWVSLVVTLDEGDMAEVGVTGREGMVGLQVVFGVDRALSEAMVQSPGSALRISVKAFRRELEEIPALRTQLLRYSAALLAQTSQTAACNSSHNLTQRLARWLLEAHDRTDGDVLPLTHEFIAMMLGARRPSVTGAAGHLQSVGIIRYSSGSVVIIDRKRLEGMSCGCYDALIAHWRNVSPLDCR